MVVHNDVTLTRAFNGFTEKVITNETLNTNIEIYVNLIREGAF